MAEPFVSRGFRGRRQPEVTARRLPPGQYETRDFPVLSAGPTPRVRASASSVSTETPSQTVSSLDHFVTQWMSLVTVSCGSAWNSSHVQRAAGPPAPRTVKSHVASEVCGVGPAERTGNSPVSYWPGGSRRAVASGGRRPRNPRETNGSVMTSSLSSLARQRGRWIAPPLSRVRIPPSPAGSCRGSSRW